MNRKTLYHLSLGTCALFLFLTSVFAQAPSPAAGTNAEGVHAKTLWEQIKEGGWVMVPIGLCSVATMYLIGDGIIRTSRKRVAPVTQEQSVKSLFRQGDYVGAYNYCKENPSPLTNVLRVGIGLLGDGKQMAEDGMLGELAKENSNMQTYISYLSVIGVCTPMIGLLGTVTGMIKAFAKLGASGIGDPSGLSAAIGEVLVATASGLVIAIPAFGAFYFLRNRAAASIHHIQDVVNGLFRKMPYESLSGVHLGDDELYAAIPNWLVQPEADGTGSVTQPLRSGATQPLRTGATQQLS
ncbi:MAG: MotA/TolQ/ExbB proton channel family protein [Verrucomicrobiota bacterium]|nr:MotA/TolQ/ExbB proton channel family protein [Verrucomicrobiota bacterium]